MPTGAESFRPSLRLNFIKYSNGQNVQIGDLVRLGKMLVGLLFFALIMTNIHPNIQKKNGII